MRAARGTGITFVTPEKTTDVGKIATVLKLHTEFGDAGLRVEIDATRAAATIELGSQAAPGEARTMTARSDSQSDAAVRAADARAAIAKKIVTLARA